MIALLGVSSGTSPPIRRDHLYPEIGDLGGGGKEGKRAVCWLTLFRESCDPERCIKCSGLAENAFESSLGLGPRWFTLGKPFPRPHSNPWKQKNLRLENTTIIIIVIQNHRRIVKSVDRSIRTNIVTYSYKMLINYKGQTVTREWGDLPERAQPGDQR